MSLTPTFDRGSGLRPHDAQTRQRTLSDHLRLRPPSACAVTKPAVSAQILPFPSRLIHDSATGTVRHTVSAAHTRDGAICFNMADRLALLAWSHLGSHGYPRILIEDGHPSGEPDHGSFALAYRPSAAWATWGLTRQPEGILVWRCGTGTALGIYPTMDAALTALPQADDPAFI